MKNSRFVGLIILSCIFSNSALSQETIQCNSNDTKCVREHINTVKKIELRKIEMEGTAISEDTQITIINKDQSAHKNLTGLQSYDDRSIGTEKSMQGIADISIHQLHAIKKYSKNSIIKKLIQTCPDLNKNLEKLEGKKAQCLLNKDITVYFMPKDTFWSGSNSRGFLGPFPEEEDERLQLVTDGLSTSFPCDGSLIDEVKSICKMNEWKTE